MIPPKYRAAKGRLKLEGDGGAMRLRVADFLIQWFEPGALAPRIHVTGESITRDEWIALCSLVNAEWKALTTPCACGEPSYKHAEASPHASCVDGSACRSFTPATPASEDA